MIDMEDITGHVKRLFQKHQLIGRLFRRRSTRKKHVLRIWSEMLSKVAPSGGTLRYCFPLEVPESFGFRAERRSWEFREATRPRPRKSTRDVVSVVSSEGCGFSLHLAFRHGSRRYSAL